MAKKMLKMRVSKYQKGWIKKQTSEISMSKMQLSFSYIKKKVNIHNGLRKDRKLKLIFHLLFREK